MSFIQQISQDKFKYLLLIIWPFGALLFALTNLRPKSSRIVIFIFCLLFGLSFIPRNRSFDSYHYYQEFNQSSNLTKNDLGNIYKKYFSFDEKQKDLYTVTMVYLVRRISDNYHILFFVYALVFAYFYIRSFEFLLDDENFRQSLVCLLIAFLFTYSNSIFNINGVRFYTASWIAVYGLFKIVVDRNYKYLLLFGIIPLIHLSFFSFFIVLFSAVVLLRYEKMWIAVFLLSFFSGMILQELILNYSDSLPKMVQYSVNEYVSNEAIIKRAQISENLPTYAVVLNKLPYYYLNLLVFVFIINRSKFDFSVKERNIFTLILILFSFVNFTYPIPSFGGRFITLTIPFLSFFWLRIWGDTKIKWLIYAIPFVYSYSILYWFRYVVSVSEPYLYLASLPHIIIKYLTESHL